MKGRRRRLGEKQIQAIIEDRALFPEKSIARLAQEQQLPWVTLKQYVDRYAAAISVFRDLKRDELTAAWYDLFARAANQSRNTETTSSDLRNHAVTMGVATEKLQLLHGMPTQIVANLHEHRLDMTAIAQRLANVARR